MRSCLIGGPTFWRQLEPYEVDPNPSEDCPTGLESLRQHISQCNQDWQQCSKRPTDQVSAIDLKEESYGFASARLRFGIPKLQSGGLHSGRVISTILLL